MTIPGGRSMDIQDQAPMDGKDLIRLIGQP
jgi:hypothetical protein